MSVGDVNGDNIISNLDLPVDATGNSLANSFQTVNSLTNRQAVGDVNGSGAINGGDLGQNSGGNPSNGTLTVANSLGIGTTIPAGELHINSTDAANGNANLIFEGENPANGASTGRWDIASLGGTPGTPPAGNLQFSSVNAAGTTTTIPVTISQGAASNSIFVTGNGNIGMGTDIPQSRLDVVGGVRVGNDTAAYCASGTLRYNGQLQVCNNSGNWVTVGGTEIAQAYRKYGSSPSVHVVHKPSGIATEDIFQLVNNVGVLGSGASLDGIVCRKDNGWIATGCFSKVQDEDSDIYLYDNANYNGCVTNDYDQYGSSGNTLMVVICAREQ
ncbi:MAG: hypothetical protein WC546_06560 [Candidatus Omnitrophota bacterium]